MVARWRRILLASHLFPYLSPCLFPTCLLISLSSLRFFSLGAFGQRNLLVSRSSLLSPLLSVLRSGGFGDRTQVPSVFVLVSLLHSHMWLFSLGASGAQYAPCPLSVSVLVPLVLSNSCPYFSLSLSCCSSLWVLIWTHDSLGFLICPPLSSFVPSNLYPSFPPHCCCCLGKNGFPGLLCFSLTFLPLFRSHSLTLGLYHMLPYLPSYLSPTCLRILSPLPCFFPGLQHLGGRG